MLIKTDELLQRAKYFFKEHIVTSHFESLERASHLNDYNVNPFLSTYLANFLEGDSNSRSIAKALIYPRILGTALTTSFGMKTQQMIHKVFEGYSSHGTGLDLEFVDAIDGRRKYCQLKAGPNTINKDDITTIVNHFKGIKNLSRTNSLHIGLDDLVVGVLYGSESELSSHYKKIAESHPIYIGQDFWHRLTGDKRFYFHLIAAIGEVAFDVDGRDRLEDAINTLAAEIENSILKK
jgi:hypothetical protein